MSLNQTLTKYIEKSIESYIDAISERYSIDKDELYTLWYGENRTSARGTSGRGSSARGTSGKPGLDTIDMTDLSPERLSKCNKAELTALCKSKCLKCTGNKDELISRLLGKEDKSPVPSTTKVPSTKIPTTSKVAPKTSTPEVVAKLASQTSALHIRKNGFGNLEHPETRFVFHKSSQKVIGKQEDDGTVSDLTDDDIDQCRRYKFQYEIPKNLDGANLDKVKIDELDDSDIDENADEDVDVEDVEEEDEEIEDDE